jgi:hypothetical protein
MALSIHSNKIERRKDSYCISSHERNQNGRDHNRRPQTKDEMLEAQKNSPNCTIKQTQIYIP